MIQTFEESANGYTYCIVFDEPAFRFTECYVIVDGV